MKAYRSRALLALVGSVALIATLAGCSSSGSAGSSPTSNPSGLPVATAGGAVVAYHGTVGSGITVVGKTQHSPVVTIAANAPAPTKLISTDLVLGTGATAQATSTVDTSYIGVSFDTHKVFNNSYPTGQTVNFPLNQVIPGWQQGIPGMKVGGVRALVIPPNLAYGSNPPPGAPAGPLVFVIELQGVS